MLSTSMDPQDETARMLAENQSSERATAMEKIRIEESERRVMEKGLYRAMRQNACRDLKKYPTEPIFEASVDVNDERSHALFDKFLDHLPTGWKQVFQCNACQRSVRKWGAFVCINPSTGKLIPLFWNPIGVPLPFRDSVRAVAGLLSQCAIRRRLNGLPEVRVTGEAESTSGLDHMHFDFTSSWSKIKKIDSVGFNPTSTKESAMMLERIVNDNTREAVNYAAHLLLEDRLPYSSNHKSSIRWLHRLYEHEKILEKDGICRQNLIWYFAARFYVGQIHFLHSGAVSELLFCIRENWSFSLIQRKWSALVRPVTYMRPTALLKANDTLVAEKLFAELNLTKYDMRRAFLAPDQIPSSAFLYRALFPPVQEPRAFSRVKPGEQPTQVLYAGQGEAEGVLPTIRRISFATFVQFVIPTVQKLELKLPTVDNVSIFITGLPGSTPLMKWHGPGNLASWYTNTSGKPMQAYGLEPGWVRVPYVVGFPHMWSDLERLNSAPPTYRADSTATLCEVLLSDAALASFKYPEHGIQYLFGVEGATDADETGSALFPQFLKPDFYSVILTIRAHSEAGTVESQEAGKSTVAGVAISKAKGQEPDRLFRVTDWKGEVQMYRVTSWE